MPVPYTFGSATSAIPLSQLDSNFATAVTIGNTAVQLGNTVTTLNNMTLANVTVSGATANAVVYTSTSGAFVANSAVISVDSSGNVGIGTSSPAAKLDVNGAGIVRGFLTTTDAIKLGANTSAPSSTDAFIYRPADNTLGFGTANTERMRIDTSGNVGIGVTPSAWYSGITAIQMSASSLYNYSVNGNRQTQLVNNAYINTSASFIYQNTDPATRYMQTGGQHQWFYAASGTAGNAITFTQAMTLDASGNFLVGTTSQSGRATIKGSTSNGTSNVLKLVDSADADIMAMSTAGDFYLPKMGSSTGTTVVLTSGNYLVKSSSSIRYKKDVEPIDIGLNFILGLNPVKYKLKEDDIDQVGFIAEDFPDARLVSESMIDPQDKTKGFQREGVLYAQIVAPLVKAIQELKSIIDTQASTITDLTDRITALENPPIPTPPTTTTT